MGPVLLEWKDCTLLTMASMAVAYCGTPWSGHEVKWNCRTSLTSLLDPDWRRGRGEEKERRVRYMCENDTSPISLHYTDLVACEQYQTPFEFTLPPEVK